MMENVALTILLLISLILGGIAGFFLPLWAVMAVSIAAILFGKLIPILFKDEKGIGALFYAVAASIAAAAMWLVYISAFYYQWQYG